MNHKPRPNLKPQKASFSHATKLAVEEMVFKTVEELGYECVQGSFVRETDRLVLRIFIDSFGGINVRDCERVSKKVSRMLDESFDEELSEHYTLEVGSPGIERPLVSPKDYVRFTGKKARVRTESKKIYIGKISGADEANVTICTDDETIKIPFEEIRRANLVWDPDEEGEV